MRIHCPTCGKQDEAPAEFQWRPFCSRRCKMIDLGNWLDEVYRFSRPIGFHAPSGAEGADDEVLSQLEVARDD